MITISEVLVKDEGSCNCCEFSLIKKPKVVYKLVFHYGSAMSTSHRLCKNHLNERGCAVADALDPPGRGDKQSVGWQKVIEGNAKRRKT